MHPEPTKARAAVACDMCGQPTAKLDPAGRCLSCEARVLDADAYAVDVALDLVEAAVEAALAGRYVSPGDLLDRVRRVVERHHGSAVEPLSQVLQRLRDNRAARDWS